MSTQGAGETGTILITGTSRGIGHHLAQVFLALGYGVIGLSRSGTSLDDVNLRKNFRSIRVDMSDLKQVQGLGSELAGEPIVGLINNAGIHGPIGCFEKTPIDAWIQTFYVNLFGGSALTQLCIPSLRRHKGFIIFLSGGGSAIARPNFSAYGVSKTAVVRFSEVLAQELAPEVLVYGVAPGPNPTQLLEEAVRGGEIVPDGEAVDFGYIERLCGFLARNRDSRYSGKFIHVRDNYEQWDDRQLAPDAHNLRRIDARTLGRVDLSLN